MAEYNNEREFFTLTDEEGNEVEFELIGTTEYNGNVYYAMIPADAADQAQESDEGFCEYVILRAEKGEGDDDCLLVTVDDDDEFDDVADLFDDMFSEEIDYDGND